MILFVKFFSDNIFFHYFTDLSLCFANISY